jgi:sporulation protein YlmC with PRC-barrel domain
MFVEPEQQRASLKEQNMEHRDETSSLISAEKVIGTNVYNTAGDSLGDINDVMIDKKSGRIAYAVMSFGGFLGIGERYHPLPWSTLKYDPRQGGYVVGLTKEQLEQGPTYAANENPAWGDRAYEQRIHDYYRTQPYWGGV